MTSKIIYASASPSNRIFFDALQHTIGNYDAGSKIINFSTGDYRDAGVDSIKSMISKASILVAEISNASPSVMYEIGLAQALNLPILLFADGSRSIPFELNRYLVQMYSKGSFVDLTAKLAIALAKFFKTHSSKNQQTGTELELAKKSRKVFISYSHSDTQFLERILIHLKPLENENAIDLWVDTRIKTGEKWKDEISRELSLAKIAILIISADFLASSFIINNELPIILRNAEGMGTRILPILVKPSRFARDAKLSIFQAINNPADTICSLPISKQEEIYDKLSEEVEMSLKYN